MYRDPRVMLDMDVFFSRRPILDARKEVWAYEMRFRPGFEGLDDAAIARLGKGVAALASGKKTVVRMPPDTSPADWLSSFPRGNIVVALSAPASGNRDAIESCRQLKAQGFSLAFFDPKLPMDGGLLEICEGVIVDFQKSTGIEREFIPSQMTNPERSFCLGENVQTHETFRQAIDLGYTHCMGDFITTPASEPGREITESDFRHLRSLCELNSRPMTVGRLASILGRDVDQSRRLLRSLNSRRLGLMPLASIREALEYLPVREVTSNACSIAISSLGQGKTGTLTTLCLIRASFCSHLASVVGPASREGEGFLVGALSLLDALLDQPLSDLLPEAPTSDEVKGALTGEQTELRRVLDCALALENGNWERLSSFSHRFGISEANLSRLYQQAIESAGRTTDD